ncbi:MAG TPA: GNAT family N-acetyltransferase [Solirubrobacteraceae bacterium]
MLDVPADSRLVITTGRLRLDPLTAADATELHPVLADPSLYTFIGGQPPTLTELTKRFAQWERRRSPAGNQLWLNWVVRVAPDNCAVGYVQATIDADDVAEVAYVVGSAWSGKGIATEATGAMCARLWQMGIRVVRAHVHPSHAASEAVARRVGLCQTGELDGDGEQLWELNRPGSR